MAVCGGAWRGCVAVWLRVVVVGCVGLVVWPVCGDTPSMRSWQLANDLIVSAVGSLVTVITAAAAYTCAMQGSHHLM